MKLSKETLQLLKNYASINTNLLIKPGNKISTWSVHKTVLSEAVVQEKFEHTFGIYDLNEFLGTLSLFEEPELEFKDEFVTIRSGKASLKFIASQPDILFVPDKSPKVSNPLVEFTLSAGDLTMINKTASVLKVPDVSFVGRDGELKVVVQDKKNPSGNTFEHILGETDKTFQLNLRIDNFKMLNDSYDVSVYQGASKFSSTTTDLVYFLAVEADSKFPK